MEKKIFCSSLKYEKHERVCPGYGVIPRVLGRTVSEVCNCCGYKFDSWIKSDERKVIPFIRSDLADPVASQVL